MLATMIWYLIQQGTEYTVLGSDKPPALDVPDGNRRKVVRATYPTKDAAMTKGKEFAERMHGTFKGSL